MRQDLLHVVEIGFIYVTLIFMEEKRRPKRRSPFLFKKNGENYESLVCLNYLTPKSVNHEQILFLIEISHVILRSLPVGLILRCDVDHPVDRLYLRSF